ncbi:MAG: hypothetical protein AABZ39_02610 [Spirochaetota bacterium]
MRRSTMFPVRITALMLCMSGFLSGYSYNAWNGLIAERTVFVNPFLSTSSVITTNTAVTAGADLVCAYGATKNADIFASLAQVGVTPSFAFFNWVMPRFAITPEHIIALQISSTFVTPQYHFFWENDVLALEVNVLARMPYSDIRTATVSAVIAPVWRVVKDAFALYVEFDPACTFDPTAPNARVSAAVLPGIWFSLPGTGFQGSIGANCFGLGTGASWGLGVVAWFSYAFALK